MLNAIYLISRSLNLFLLNFPTFVQYLVRKPPHVSLLKQTVERTMTVLHLANWNWKMTTVQVMLYVTMDLHAVVNEFRTAAARHWEKHELEMNRHLLNLSPNYILMISRQHYYCTPLMLVYNKWICSIMIYIYSPFVSNYKHYF